MISLFFGLFSLLSLTISILALIYKDKLDDGDNTLPALIIFSSTLSFIFFSISCAVFYKSNEDLYSDCLKNVNKEAYCIKYLKE